MRDDAKRSGAALDRALSRNEAAGADRIRPLVVATAANYLWQLPYAVHQYGSRWLTLTGLSIPLVATGFWFAVAARRFVRGQRFGRTLLAGFLVTEASFYLLHNVSGAFLVDLPTNNPVVLIASVLGYVNLVFAAYYLIQMKRHP